ncbi:hypothetical protein ACLOJK_011723 [Asimina triloba]
MASIPVKLATLVISLLLNSLISSSMMRTVDAKANKAGMMKQFVDAHNSARKDVGVPPLKWDTKLANFARAYSTQRRQDCALVHSPSLRYGENIFIGDGPNWRGRDAVAAWVDEKKWYNYSTNSCSGPDCTHYTQIVWRTTQSLGCAKIICDSGSSYITCEYYPPGNYIGDRPY